MEQVVGGSWRIEKKVGSGTFAEVYSGTNVETRENVAIKLELRKSKHPQLLHESKIYEVLQGERKKHLPFLGIPFSFPLNLCFN